MNMRFMRNLTIFSIDAFFNLRLSKDLAEIKRLKYETRRNLEAYWREQISIKASKQQALLAA
jgi:hypothetical protein